MTSDESPSRGKVCCLTHIKRSRGEATILSTVMILSVADALNWLGDFLSTLSPLFDDPRTFTSHMLNYRSMNDKSDEFLYFPDKKLLSWLGPCDADALAGCISSSADLVFVDLDEASFDLFQRFKQDQGRLLLFYEPSFIDPYFVDKNNSTVTWLVPDNMQTMEVGRVNCRQNPSLCTHVDMLNGPTVKVLHPHDFVAATITSELYNAPHHQRHVAATITSELYNAPHHQRHEDRIMGYERECLWRRFGADALTRTCQNEMRMINATQTELKDSTYINNLVEEGRRIAYLWNALVLSAAFVLLVALGLVGWKLLKRCLIRSCGFQMGRATRSSASMSKEERKAQLRQQVSSFYLAAVLLGLTNMFLPVVTLCIGGPIAVGALVWLWYVEFKCATTWTDCPTQAGATTDDEKDIALLSGATAVVV